MLGTRTFLAFAALPLLTLQTLPAQAQNPPPPVVSPHPIADIPLTTFDPSRLFADYSWRSFIALNWPAKTGAANRGQPDRTKAFGDVSGPRLWSTWKSRYEIFQPEGKEPSPWASYEGKNPCGPGFSNDVMTLSSFTAFGDFNQADFSLSTLGNPLVAQNRQYVRYEVRVNQPQFESIVGHKWYLASNLPENATPVPFNNGSIELKASWRILTAADTPAVRARYYIVPKAQVFDVATAKCTLQDVALVGLHIVAKTPNRPQWIWSSFEHVDNVPPASTEPVAPAGTPLSFNNPAQPQALNPADAPPALNAGNKPVVDPAPMQVVRQQKITPESMEFNMAYWNLPEIKGTVWQNYMLVMTQWPTKIAPEAPSNLGDPFPSSGSNLANTTMETYVQDTSCMRCHHVANRRGRDFVMFVTFDAFRPGVPAPADLFSARISGDAALAPSRSLSNDTMIRDLVDFFNAAKKK